MDIPREEQQVFDLLEREGFHAYAVGGCVRDWLLGRPSHDVDITTDALCSEVRPLLEAAGIRVFETGIEHGTITAVVAGKPIEITTFRIDGPYLDYRHPREVTFTRSLAEDLSRRDFTINAMAFNPQDGLIDLYGGKADLDKKQIVCVGDATTRFNEDALRIFRALRFASQLGFIIAEDTANALRAQSHLLLNISQERIANELSGFIRGANVRPVLMEYIDVIGVVIPELLPMIGFDQHNYHHVYDILEHTAVALENVPPDLVLRLAILLHDVGKPECFSIGEDGLGHFYGHAAKSEEITQVILRRLKYPTALIRDVCLLVSHHDAPFVESESNVKHQLRRFGPTDFARLLAVKRADTLALNPVYHSRLEELDAIEGIAQRLLEEEACFSLKDLAVDGDDLIALGVHFGPQVGLALNWLLDQVLEGHAENTATALLKLARTNCPYLE